MLKESSHFIVFRERGNPSIQALPVKDYRAKAAEIQLIWYIETEAPDPVTAAFQAAQDWIPSETIRELMVFYLADKTWNLHPGYDDPDAEGIEALDNFLQTLPQSESSVFKGKVRYETLDGILWLDEGEESPEEDELL